MARFDGAPTSLSGSEVPHWGQNPIHLGDRCPQDSQMKLVFELTSVRDYLAGLRESRGPRLGPTASDPQGLTQ